MRTLFHIIGHAACFAAVLAMLGGHWLMLQSVAWTRMLIEFSRDGSISVAISKTFDGKHPCRMCVEIKEGRQEEEKRQKNTPVSLVNKMPDLASADMNQASYFSDLATPEISPFVTHRYENVIHSPLKPPPRIQLWLNELNAGMEIATDRIFSGSRDLKAQSRYAHDHPKVVQPWSHGIAQDNHLV